MTQRKRSIVVGQVVVAACVAVGTGLVYHAFVDRWEGDARAPIVAAGMAGIAFFFLTVLTLSLVERTTKRKETRAPHLTVGYTHPARFCQNDKLTFDRVDCH